MMAGALFRNESVKTFKRPAFWITLGSFSAITTLAMWDEFQDAARDPEQTFALPSAWANLFGGMAELGLIFASIITLLLIAGEFSWRTARQNVIDGLSRSQFLSGKLIVIPLIAVVFVVPTVVIGGGLALAGTDMSLGEPLMRMADVRLLGAYLLALVGYLSVAFFVATAVRSPGPAMAVWFFYVALLEQLLGGALSQLGAVGTAIASWMPIATFRRLVNPLQWDPEAFSQAVADATAAGETAPSILPAGVLLGVTALYVGLLLGGSLAWFRRRDL